MNFSLQKLIKRLTDRDVALSGTQDNFVLTDKE